ncbi:receptor-interacting serine/threonine-protein kinase 4 [Menidia menidia]
MALCGGQDPAEIGDSALEDWNEIDSGGFGIVYKARHRHWWCDVAIKLLHCNNGTSRSLLREVNMMRRGSSPYVIHVYGLYKGQPPSSGSSVQLGLVMEFMERGSLASLQRQIPGIMPWPLAFRLTHQVAQGINYLHSLSPALLHLDLKPSNVLLDSALNAKLTDFGLSKLYHSITGTSRKENEEEGGTLKYMPPEAFQLSYSPAQASDIYSYGVLVWSILTGKQPYANAKSSIVRFRIPRGDRPSLDEIRGQATGLTNLVNLIQKCWEARPSKRPTSLECTTVTGELFKMHKRGIHDAVHQVLKNLDQKQEEEVQEPLEQFQRFQTTQPQETATAKAVNPCDDVPTGRPPVQEMSGCLNPSQRTRERVKDSSLGPPGADQKVKKSSVHPIQSSCQVRAEKNSQLAFKEPLSPMYQRQFSSPDLSTSCLPRRVTMHFSNVTGFQYGDNNTMYISNSTSMERKRHPTAPSTVPLTSHITQ